MQFLRRSTPPVKPAKNNKKKEMINLNYLAMVTFNKTDNSTSATLQTSSSESSQKKVPIKFRRSGLQNNIIFSSNLLANWSKTTEEDPKFT